MFQKVVPLLEHFFESFSFLGGGAKTILKYYPKYFLPGQDARWRFLPEISE